MGGSQTLPLTLGALAISSSVALLTFDIIFAAALPPTPHLAHPRVAAIVSSSLAGVDVALLLLLVGRQMRYRNGGHIQDFGHGRQHIYIVAGVAGTFAILTAVASALMLATTRMQIATLRQSSIIHSTKLVTGGFIIWGAFLLAQALFVVYIVAVQRRGLEKQSQPSREEPDTAMFPQMEEARIPQAQTQHEDVDRGQSSMETVETATTPSSSGRSRAGSDTMSSLRSSLSQVVRPITSKTRLIQTGQKSPHRSRSIASSHRDSSIEEGFDSWDTSAVDAQSRYAVESVSPVGPQRFLETIPASPTGSRSPSPGFPLDLEPPKACRRSRSYSPVNSPKDRERFQKSRTASPSESMNEGHIHPLFRTDSPTPPPSATPSTNITAAPNAGQLISDRQSIRSIHRMRSGSLPSSPLAHSASLDSIHHAIEREELEQLEEAGEERTLTPPIPEYILNGGPRNSLSGYNSRKKPTGLGLDKVGEDREG